MQVFAFYQVGGFDGFFDIYASLISDIDELVKVSEEVRTILQKKQLQQAFGTIELMLQLVHPIISAKTLFDSAQTAMIISRDKRETDVDYFEPHNFLVKLRFAALPTVRRLWESSWLAEAPVGVSRYVVRCMLEIVNGENEDGKSDPSDASVPPVIPRAAPSETHIRLLTDMGFPRSAVERALAHANNDVNSATEYLLSLPFPLPPDPEPPNFQPEGTMEETMATEETPEGSRSNTDAGGSPPPPTIDNDANPSAPSQGRSSDEWRQVLDEAREPLKINISKRSLSLIDEHLSLLFDLHIVFTKGSKHQEQAIRNLVDDISSFSANAYDVQEQPLANRCRLLALVLCEKPSSLEPELRNTLMERLLALLLTTRDPENPSKWLAAHMLVTEALFTLADEPRTISVPKEGETIVPGSIAVGPPRPEARSIVFDFCLQLLTNDDLPADELLSVLRLFVLLTRDRQMAAKFVNRDGLSSLFRRLRKSAVTGGSSYVASVLRHIVEDVPIIQGIMQQTIKGYFSQSRRIVDLPTYVKNCSAIALRDMDLFINVTNNMCLVENPHASPHIKFQPGVQPTDKNTASGENSTEMQIDSPPTSASCSIPNKSVEAVIHLLVNELMDTTKSINETPSASALDPNSPSARHDTIGDGASSKSESNDQASPPIDVQDRHQYLCFVMQCLTELLFSYDSCKIAFLSYSSKKRPQQSQTKELSTKFRTTTLHFLLSDIITYSTINPASDPKNRNRATLCSWAMNVVGALCVDTSAAQETKEISSDLLLVRKFVLETISRAIKEIWSSTESTEARYGRLLALADLCHRLLTVRVNPNTRKQQQDDIPTHLAKIMLEKNFVATLTNALSEVDLNYPNVRNLVASVLRPLEHL
jgi:E3 ubiquitin-protein ligase HUWE1